MGRIPVSHFGKEGNACHLAVWDAEGKQECHPRSIVS